MFKLTKLIRPSEFCFPGDDGITLDSVKKFLKDKADDKDVKAFLGTINPITDDRVKSYLNDDEDGKALAGRLFDARVTESTKKFEKNFKEEKLPGLIEAEYKKKHPEETPAEKENRALMEKVKALEEKNTRSELKAKALAIITESKLPFAKMVDNLIGKDEETTVSLITGLKSVWSAELDAAVKAEMAKENGRGPGGGGDGKPTKETLEKQLEEASRKGDTLTVIKLKDQMFNMDKKRLHAESGEPT